MEGEYINLEEKKERGMHQDSRVMFCIKDGTVRVAPFAAGSHIDWFEREGWATKENAISFLEHHVRGYYFPDKKILYCYRGADFAFDNWVLRETINHIAKLKAALLLSNDTEIRFGPKSGAGDFTQERVSVDILRTFGEGMGDARQDIFTRETLKSTDGQD